MMFTQLFDNFKNMRSIRALFCISLSALAGSVFGGDRVPGNVAGWGLNSVGQAVGVAATNLPPISAGFVMAAGQPVAGAVAVAGGMAHGVALKKDGTVAGWGGTSQTAVPAGLSNIVAIAAGREHSLALKQDGTVVGWGTTRVPDSP